jgi:hypothetical protein
LTLKHFAVPNPKNIENACKIKGTEPQGQMKCGVAVAEVLMVNEVRS